MTQLSGWMRLWIVAAVAWLILVTTYETWTILSSRLEVVSSQPLDGGPIVFFHPRLRALRDGFLLWTIPTVTVYALGCAVRWVSRGFSRST